MLALPEQVKDSHLLELMRESPPTCISNKAKSASTHRLDVFIYLDAVGSLRLKLLSAQRAASLQSDGTVGDINKRKTHKKKNPKGKDALNAS